MAWCDTMSTAITYQGRLSSTDGPVTGVYDLELSLWTSPTGSVQTASTVTATGVQVSEGLFTVGLDFGSGVFDGRALWLQIGVRTNGGDAFATMLPRQALAAAPYANYAPNAGLAAGVPAGTISTAMLKDGAVTSAKIGAEAVKASNIDDGGEAAYEGFAQHAKALVRVEPLPFSGVLPIGGASGSVSFSLALDGSTLGTVVGAAGYEAMSEPYEFVVEVILPSGGLEPEAQLGKAARLTIGRKGGNSRFAGIVTGCSASSWDGEKRLYTFRFESPLAYLALTTNYKIYQETSVPTIAAELYSTLGHQTLTQSLKGSYPKRSLALQYAETGLNFFSRLLEEEGIFYFFNVEGGLVLGDDVTAYLPCASGTMAYYGNTSTNVPEGAEIVRTFHMTTRESVRTSKIRTYDFEKPATFPSGSTVGTAGVGEFYQFGSASSATLAAQAAARQGANDAGRVTHFGSGNGPDLRPGCTFVLEDHSGSELGNTYLVTAVRHAAFRRTTAGVTNYFYGNEFEVIPAALTFRPERKTRKPAALPCTAKVTGPAGEEVSTDSYGRVKVQFHWDRYGALNETSSAWIRFATPMAGKGRGMMFLPRIGDEVVVQFLQGDPDQPVITGSMYNASGMPPYELPDNKATSTIRTRSTPTAGSVANEIRFKDSSGAESLDIMAAKDFLLTAENNMSVTSRQDVVMGVGRNMVLTGGGDMNLTVGKMVLSTASGVGIGTAPDASLALKVGGTVGAGGFKGDGSQLSNLAATALTGTISDARIPSNIARLNSTQVFTGDTSFLGKVGIGSSTGTDTLNVGGNARMNDYDIYLRGNNGDTAHGLGWYGTAKPFGTSPLDGPVLYGCGGGSLGTICGGQKVALSWNNAGNVGIGVYSPATRLEVGGTITATGISVNGSMSSTGLVVNGDARVTGLMRLGSETGTSQPADRSLIFRRVRSTSNVTNQIVARTDALTLERDGTTSGLLIRHGALPGVQTINAIGLSNTGAVVPFRAVLNSPAAAGTVQLFTSAQRIVHAQISFGNTFNSGHVTQVVLDRYDDSYTDDNFWIGTLASTYNQ